MNLKSIGHIWAVCFSATIAFADLRVVGTDLLGLEFTKAFYTYAGRSGTKLALAFDGSRPGMEELRAGRADIAIVTITPEESKTPLEGFRILPFAYHGVVVLVPPACPLERVTLEQLALVFGAPAVLTGTYSVRWQELGASGSWASAGVVPIMPDDGAGLTSQYFRSTVLGGRPFRTNVARFADQAELLQHFAGESRVMGLAAGVPGRSSTSKVLPVAVNATQAAIHATPETLHAGTYPLRLPVQLVVRPGGGLATTALLNFLYSDEVARLLEAAALVPLPSAERTRQLGLLR